VLTRGPESENAKLLSKFPNVTLVTGSPDNDADLKRALAGIDYAFVNLNSWALGIKNEIFWGIRIFEIAVQSGVKHYIWSSLDNNYFHPTGYDDSLRVGHYYGKGHVAQWMMAVPQSPMRWTVICTSPYVEQLWDLQMPRKTESGEYEFRSPVGAGAVPFTALDDMGYYVRWILDNPERSSGMDLKVSIEHVSLPMMAQAFTEATGKPARATSLSIEEWFRETGLEKRGDHKMGSSSAPEDASLLTVKQNFSAWWRLYQQSGENEGLLKRDYNLLDEIHPGRTRTLKEWMEKVQYTGETHRKHTVTSPWQL